MSKPRAVFRLQVRCDCWAWQLKQGRVKSHSAVVLRGWLAVTDNPVAGCEGTYRCGASKWFPLYALRQYGYVGNAVMQADLTSRQQFALWVCGGFFACSVVTFAALAFCGVKWWFCRVGLAGAFRLTWVEDFYKGTGRSASCLRTSCNPVSKVWLESNVFSFCRIFFFICVCDSFTCLLSSSDVSVVSESQLAAYKVNFVCTG